MRETPEEWGKELKPGSASVISALGRQRPDHRQPEACLVYKQRECQASKVYVIYSDSNAPEGLAIGVLGPQLVMLFLGVLGSWPC